MKATISGTGRVTIPKLLRDKLGVKAGTKLDIREENGKLVAVKANVADRMRKVYGCLGKGIETDKVLAELRGRTASNASAHGTS